MLNFSVIILRNKESYFCFKAVLFTCDDFSGELNTDCNEGDLVWVPFDEIKNLPLWEGDKVFLKLLAEDAPFFSLTLKYKKDALIEVLLNGEVQMGTVPDCTFYM